MIVILVGRCKSPFMPGPFSWSKCNKQKDDLKKGLFRGQGSQTGSPLSLEASVSFVECEASSLTKPHPVLGKMQTTALF